MSAERWKILLFLYGSGNPIGVINGDLGNELNYNGNGCGALATTLTLAPGETKHLAFILAMKPDQEAESILKRYQANFSESCIKIKNTSTLRILLGGKEMEENKDSMFKEENKKDNVKAPWQEEMAPEDFVGFAPSYRAGKYFSLYEKNVFPCDTVGDITYYLYDPVKNGKDASKQYPLLVFFHGASNALDGELCINYCGGELYASEAYQESMGGGAYILIPVANEKRMPDGKVIGGWSEDYIAPCMELIRKVKAEVKNVSKTVLFGNSRGGTFIWELLLNTPDEFDGFVPMGAGYTPNQEEIDLLRTKEVNLLLTHARRDELTPFDVYLACMEEELQKMENCICYFPEWVRNSDGGVASINFGFEMGQHCIVNAVHSNLIFDDGRAYDERLPEGVTGWIRSIL